MEPWNCWGWKSLWDGVQPFPLISNLNLPGTAWGCWIHDIPVWILTLCLYPHRTCWPCWGTKGPTTTMKNSQSWIYSLLFPNKTSLSGNNIKLSTISTCKGKQPSLLLKELSKHFPPSGSGAPRRDGRGGGGGLDTSSMWDCSGSFRTWVPRGQRPRVPRAAPKWISLGGIFVWITDSPSKLLRWLWLFLFHSRPWLFL